MIHDSSLVHVIIFFSFFPCFFFFFKVHLLGQTPGATDISSIAILPRLFLPTIPSKTIWKQLKKGRPFYCRLLRHIWYFITLKGLDDATGAWAIYQLLPASPLSPQILRSGALPPIVRMKTLSSPMPEPNMWVQNLKEEEMPLIWREYKLEVLKLLHLVFPYIYYYILYLKANTTMWRNYVKSFLLAFSTKLWIYQYEVKNVSLLSYSILRL